MKKITAFILLLLSLVSCNEKTAQDLFDESKTGVVLILNEYYYVMKLPNGNSIYFTGIDKEGNLENLAFEYADIKNKRQILTGTGFFIDKQGTIMTNRHVAQPSIDKTAVKESYNNMVASIKAYYAAQMSALSQEYQNLESQKSDCIREYGKTAGNSLTTKRTGRAVQHTEQRKGIHGRPRFIG